MAAPWARSAGREGVGACLTDMHRSCRIRRSAGLEGLEPRTDPRRVDAVLLALVLGDRAPEGRGRLVPPPRGEDDVAQRLEDLAAQLEEVRGLDQRNSLTGDPLRLD